MLFKADSGAAITDLEARWRWPVVETRQAKMSCFIACGVKIQTRFGWNGPGRA